MKTSSRLGMMLTAFAWIASDPAVQAQDNSIVIDETVKLQSAIFNEGRTLQISLPDRYRDSLERYPVIFVLDGEGQFAQAVGAVRSLQETDGQVRLRLPAGRSLL